MEYHVKIIGMSLITLSLIHVIFPRYFNWKKELSSLSLINRQMMMVHTFFIALTVLLMGLLCLTSTMELIQTELGRKVSLGLGIFWSCRLIVQFFGYSSKLWKGKKLETVIHIASIFYWSYMILIFFIIAIN